MKINGKKRDARVRGETGGSGKVEENTLSSPEVFQMEKEKGGILWGDVEKKLRTSHQMG